MVVDASVGAPLFAVHDQPGQVELGLDDPIADTKQDDENKAEQALDRVRVVDVIVHLASGGCGVVILSAVQVDGELLIGVILVLVLEFGAVDAQNS